MALPAYSMLVPGTEELRFAEGSRIDLDEPPPARELDVDAALEELKRRMGED